MMIEIPNITMTIIGKGLATHSQRGKMIREETTDRMMEIEEDSNIMILVRVALMKTGMEPDGITDNLYLNDNQGLHAEAVDLLQ